MVKRARFSSAPRAVRPVDKRLVNIVKATLGATQASTTIASVTTACTVTGIRIQGNAIRDAGSVNGSLHWALVIVRDGTTLSTLAVTDASVLYAPE